MSLICGTKKIKIPLSYKAIIPLLGKDSDKTIIQKDTGTSVFTAVLLTTAKTWK